MGVSADPGNSGYRREACGGYHSTSIPANNSHKQALPFTRVAHKVETRDAQPASATIASILVMVTGQLIVDDGTNTLQFSQMFHLVPDGGSYFVYVIGASWLRNLC